MLNRPYKSGRIFYNNLTKISTQIIKERLQYGEATIHTIPPKYVIPNSAKVANRSLQQQDNGNAHQQYTMRTP